MEHVSVQNDGSTRMSTAKRAAVTRIVTSSTQTDSNTSEAAMQTEPVQITNLYGDTVVIDKSSQASQSVSVTAESDSVAMSDDPKDLSYDPDGSQATSQSPVPVVSVVNDRKFAVFGCWVAKPVYDVKSYDHVSDMMHSVVDQQETHSLLPIGSSHQNIAPIPAPAKDELL